jgi:pimeloyl-ACP methyl ester carboxylesterase
MDGTGEPFAEFVSMLAPELQAIVVSYPPDKPLGYLELEVIARSRVPSDRPFVLLAESFSGPIAVSLAASSPRGLLGLILSCSFVKNPRPCFRLFRSIVSFLPVRCVPAAFLGHALLGRFSSAPLLHTLARVLRIVSPEAIRARIRAVLDIDVASCLAEVRVPVLYLRATEDRVVPAAASRLILRWLPSARVVDVEAPHFLLQAVPGVAAEHVESFVRELAVGT